MPAAIENGGIDLVTTLFVPTILFSPIVTPGRIEAFSPDMLCHLSMTKQNLI